MSGIVGSRFNIRGSGLVGSLGTDGQVFTSAGAGKSAVFEAAAAGGKVGQVVQGEYSTHFTTTSNSYVDVGLSGAITPAATSSKILVMVYIQTVYSGGALDSGVVLHLARDIDSGGYGTVADDYWGQAYMAVTVDQGHDTENAGSHGNTAIYLDSPNTTGACTYKVQGSAIWGGSGTFNHNSRSTITLMEILA